MARYLSLGTKLTASFALLGLGPLLFMAAIALMVITQTHRQDVATMETQLLAQKIGEINKFIEERTVGIFEIRVGYSGTSIISPTDQEFLLQQLLEENQFIIEASFIDLTGAETLKWSKLYDTQKIGLSDVRLLPKFQTAKEGQTYFGPVYYTLEGPMMTVASPVFNRDNQVIMVLTGEISLEPLSRSIVTASLGTDGYVYLVDQNGMVAASAEKGMIGRYVGDAAWIKTLLAGEKHDGLSKEDKRIGLTGVEVLAAGLPFPKLGWGIVVEWPVDDAFAVVSTIQLQVMLFLLLTVMVVILLGFFVGRKILKPLSMLKQGAVKIGAGQFDYKIKIDTHDEIHELGEVLNRVGDDLKQLEELKAARIRAEALAESLRKERELSRMREEFLSNTSHQLRTPMSIANWNFDLVANAKTEEDRKEALGELDTGLRQLNAIITDLMVVAEYGVGWRNKVYKEIKLSQMLSRVLETRQKALDEKKISFSNEVPQDLPAIQGHPAIQNVMENLLDNAITYTKEHGKISISAKAEGENMHVSVSDNGIGILEKDKSSIFTQFFRGENAIVQKNVGTGLGLLICKNIVEGHDGKIWFESKENQGTTIHFTVPLGKKPEQESVKQKTA